MGKKILAVILGIVTLITAWSTIKMFLAMAHTGNSLYVSYAPLPIQLMNPNFTVILISAVIYTLITIVLAIITVKLGKSQS
ncbi:hypothetical protein ACEE08_03800 [Staphylococcus rostri]|uniref:Uncharacterized protein n=1 Tax=Staphylococcus rostri TaxID=522262 RepID=A0A2K3YYW0_9STAP|nr:hypothetical protein [Staphylococcus rostri]PNZ30484.1 hypothetical protein CD122_00365 [Staphylococcus rostri]